MSNIEQAAFNLFPFDKKTGMVTRTEAVLRERDAYIKGLKDASTASQGLILNSGAKVQYIDESTDMPSQGLKPEELAEKFHTIYEKLAPQFGYKTKEESAKPWGEVPEQNKQLMIAVCKGILNESTPTDDRAEHAQRFAEWIRKDGWKPAVTPVWTRHIEGRSQEHITSAKLYALWPERDKVEGQGVEVVPFARFLRNYKPVYIDLWEGNDGKMYDIFTLKNLYLTSINNQ